MAIGFKGTSISDIEQGAEDALEEDIANLSPASNSVAANLDGGVAAVDWASKTHKFAFNHPFTTVSGSTTTNIISVSGSGYVTFTEVLSDSDDVTAHLEVDGTDILNAKPINGPLERYDGSLRVFGFGLHGPIRFDSSLTVSLENMSSYAREAGGGVSYALD